MTYLFIFYLFLFLIFYVYIGYFILILVLGFFYNRKVKKEKNYPNICFMIAAYNEEKTIEEKLKNTLCLDYPKDKLKIVVVSDASSDQTDLIVKKYLSDNVQLIRIEGRVGKTQARNEAVKMVDEEIIVFSDATTIYHKNALTHLVQNFSDPEVGMVTGHLIYTEDANSSMSVGQSTFWQYESLIKKAQTKLGTLTGSVGCITAFRRKLYTELPAHIIEDFTGPLCIIQKGYRVVYEDKALCFEKPTKRSRNEFSMRVRVIRGGMTGLFFAREVLNPLQYPMVSFQLISHKILRWLSPLIFAFVFIFSNFLYLIQVESLLVSLCVWLEYTFLFLVFLGFLCEKKSIKINGISFFYYFFVLNLAASKAMIDQLYKTLPANWETDR
jgi:cellulose synthase/poly-beta-1,6-N-acetylglucosamine synthase-like glycosyltransferase